MVTINKITTPRHLYNQDGFVGTCETYAEVLDVQIQIAENKLEGYYFLYNGEELHIDFKGELKKFPYGFDITIMQLAELFTLRRNQDVTQRKNWKDYCIITPK